MGWRRIGHDVLAKRTKWDGAAAADGGSIPFFAATSRLMTVDDTNLSFDDTNNRLEVGDTASGGTRIDSGSVRSVVGNFTFGAGGGGQWQVNSAGGALAPAADATRDIGSSSLRVRDLYLSGDVVADGGVRSEVGAWVQENVAAGQAAVEIARYQTNNITSARWVAKRAGSITGLSAWFTAALTAGGATAFTAKVRKNGTVIAAAKLDVASPNQSNQTTFARDTHTFVAGDSLSIEVTTDAAFAPTTTDVYVDLEVEG